MRAIASSSSAALHPIRRSFTQDDLWSTRGTAARRARRALTSSVRRRASAPNDSAAGFHIGRLKKDAAPAVQRGPLTGVQVLDPAAPLTDAEIDCVSLLRAKAFYAYPPERAFAGEIHQMMIAEEEAKSLKALRLGAKLDKSEDTVTLVATCDADVVTAETPDAVDERLTYVDQATGAKRMVVGSLDVHFARALAGEFLIGDAEHAAYLANVCTAEAARRRGVGVLLLESARELAGWRGAEAIFVHTMAVNEIARAFYEKHGFVVEKEETSNQAHYRGRCLDGIEGAGRTVLLRDALFHR